MGYLVLTDPAHQRSVLYCTTTERPLDCEAFVGGDSAEQADDFLGWLGFDPRSQDDLARRGFVAGPLDPGGKTWYGPLDHAHTAWHHQSHDPLTGEFVGSQT